MNSKKGYFYNTQKNKNQKLTFTMSKLPKLANSKRSSKLITKLLTYITKYPNQFVHTNTDLLWCKLYNKKVSYEKKHGVDSHRKTRTHEDNIILSPPGEIDTILSTTHFTEDITALFLELDIPL